MLQSGATVYSGCYGAASNNGDVVITTLKCNSRPVSMANKEIILVVDHSISMSDDMPMVQNSLLAFRNSLVRLVIGQNIPVDQDETFDRLFQELAVVKLITFSDKARLIWPTAQPSSFGAAVRDIKTEASTNMGEAISLAYRECTPGKTHWIIVFTDGESNVGCRTVNSFKKLVYGSTRPKHTQLITLGFSEHFNCEILDAIGSFTYIPDKEVIPGIFGSIAAEIAEAWGFEAQLQIPTVPLELATASCPEQMERRPTHVLGIAPANPEGMDLDLGMDDEEIIAAPARVEPARSIIGSTTVGTLYNERGYIHGLLPWGHTRRPELIRYVGQMVSLNYIDIATMQPVVEQIIIQPGAVIPVQVRSSYFASSAGRIMRQLYIALKNKTVKEYREAIEAKIAEWTDPLALAHCEEIRHYLIKANPRGCLSQAVDVRRQSSHVSQNLQTPRQRLVVMSTQEDLCYYERTVSSEDSPEY
jgi:hypothetical protein